MKKTIRKEEYVYNTVLALLEQSMYKWTHAVQICVVKESNVGTSDDFAKVPFIAISELLACSLCYQYVSFSSAFSFPFPCFISYRCLSIP